MSDGALGLAVPASQFLIDWEVVPTLCASALHDPALRARLKPAPDASAAASC